MTREGEIKFVVSADGEVFIIPKYASDGTEISHAVMIQGRPVIAAGEANITGDPINGYYGIDITPRSGHYMNGNSADQNKVIVALAKSAFAKFRKIKWLDED